MGRDVKHRVMLAMADPRRMQDMRTFLLSLDMDVVGEAHDGQEALQLLPRTLTDVLLADMVLPVIDGPDLVLKIRAMSLGVMPVVILMGALPMPGFDQLALRAGAYAIIQRPIDDYALSVMIAGLTVEDRVQRLGADEGHILRALRGLGFTMRMQGTGYLVEAIRLASLDIRLIEDLQGSLYQMVALKFGTDEDKVEHAIRRAVESAWSGGALEAQHRAFGNTIDARRGKPVSGEMIARIAELLRVKEI